MLVCSCYLNKVHRFRASKVRADGHAFTEVGRLQCLVAKIKMLVDSFWRRRGGTRFLAFSRVWRRLYSLAHGPILREVSPPLTTAGKGSPLLKTRVIRLDPPASPRLLSQLQALNFIRRQNQGGLFLRNVLPEALGPHSLLILRAGVLGTQAGSLLNQELLFLTSTPRSRHGGRRYPHFTGGQTEAQKGRVTCSRPHGWQGAGLSLGVSWTLNLGLHGAAASCL